MKEPFYHLDYTSGECSFKIFLNEILVIDNLDGVKSPAGNFLLNSYIYGAGKQNIRFEVYPKKGQSEFNENCFIEIYLYGADQSKGFEDKIDIIPRQTKMPSNLLKNDSGVLLPPPVSWNVQFDAENPYSIDKNWSKGRKITSIPEYEKKVIATFTEIYQLAKERNAVQLYELMKESFNRTNVALFETEKGKSDTVKLFEQLIKHQPIGGNVYQLQDLDLGKVRVYGDGKVADVLRPDGNTILFFKKDKDEQTGVSIDIKLYSDEKMNDNQFKIL